MSRIWLAFLVIFLAVGCAAMGDSAAKGDAPRMAKEELQAILGSPDLILLDVRQGKDLVNSDRKIAGAIREDPGNFDGWRDKYPKTKTLVLYCA
ncbi:MAG: hypothetical protein EG822_02895 [Deltaproteobacteria bacterium]|nr:hypothetical protein [Deltaproteobacteria bacterium]TLN05234.1 MAG: hypothetical protein FDZ73_00970 [bacterium]